MALKIYKVARKIHKWTSIVVAIFLLFWIVSGIIYVVPLSVLHRIDRLFGGGQETQSVDVFEPLIQIDTKLASFRDYTISLKDAISLLETELEHPVKVAHCSMYKSSGVLIYAIVLEDGTCFTIDTIEGTPVKITEANIKERAIAAGPPNSKIIRRDILKKRPYAYWGPIPVHRFVFDDSSKTYVYVSPVNGLVIQNNRVKRIKHWMDSLHKFEFLLLIRDSHRIKMGIQLIFSLVALVVVITGCYIALPVKWLRRLPWNRGKLQTKSNATD